MSQPSYKPDFYSRAFIKDAMPHYRRMRELGPAVWLPSNKVWAVSRYEDVKKSLFNAESLISGKGISANGFANRLMSGDKKITLTSDGEDHMRKRGVVGKPLSKKGMKDLSQQIQNEADRLVESLLARGRFDGVRDFAEHLPVQIVSNLLGIPESGRENMLNWSTQSFNITGSYNWRTLRSIPAGIQMARYGKRINRDNIDPNGWVNNLYDAVDSGVLEEEDVPAMVNDYMGPSLDTTIIASSYMLYLLGSNPEAWEAVRSAPELIPNAVNETLRMASPVRGWCRYVKDDVDLSGTLIPKGSRVLVVLVSANYDERKWKNPETFDIHRNPRDHLAFGFGVHSCLGRHLAQLEMESLLRSMIGRVSQINVSEPKLALNNTLRGFSSMPVQFS
ncbi:cytochrome P450 [Pseudomaricurvus alkylphenolicus]|uniref:cytochrome P450 n=1 Tax=Pseudomaricurvus alkylphenolicus TaxID=1306991 RepID=UPI00142317B2|nr:cytochrome P450 [Pseudomaricurvus alkylphenolicus]NIB41775.1 cytochrome P450 [Pseudomaricurvus alkylphenolicus]